MRSHRRADAAGEDVERNQFADRELAADHQLGAEIEYPGGHHLADELHGVAGIVGKAQHAKAGGDVAGDLLLPAALHLRLDRHRLQRLDAGDALDQEGLVLGAARELVVEPRAEQRRRPGGNARYRTGTSRAR
jgi:hypothetical protein